MRKRIGQLEIAYDIYGSGEPVVLLHAFPVTRAMWQQTAASLARSCRVITMDFRGFGESELGSQYALTDLADDVSNLLDLLSIDRAAVCGLSMGGYVALAFAMRHRSRLSGLVLASTRASADAEPVRQGRDHLIAKLRAAGNNEVSTEPMVARLLSPHASPGVQAFVRSIAERRPSSLIAAVQALGDRPDRTAELPLIRCPVLVMAGADDALSPPSEMRTLSDSLAGSRFIVLPGAGHLSNLEASDAFTRAVAEFVTSL